MLELLSDHTVRTVLVGTTAIGAISGALGCFAYLRKQSMIGDVVSHSSLFGIMLFFLAGYWITGEPNKSLFILLPGAIFAGILALTLTQSIVRRTAVREDSGLGVMLAIFFGTGILMLRWTQRSSSGVSGHRGLEDYLFGMAASMTSQDLMMVSILGGTAILLLGLNWKELKLFSFDPMFAQSIGMGRRRLDLLLITLMVIGIVIGLQCVGVILMIALLITPAAAARQWSQTLGGMVLLAGLMGGFCGGIGSLTSAQFGIPTGPVIVLLGVMLMIFSVCFAPKRGVLFRKQQQRRLATDQNNRFRRDASC